MAKRKKAIMLTTRGQAVYPVPPQFSEMRQVVLFKDGYWYDVKPVSPYEISEMVLATDPPVVGFPTSYAVLPEGKTMAFYPVPDDNYEVLRTWLLPKQ